MTETPALVWDPKTREMTGELPRSVKLVYIQWLDPSDNLWYPKPSISVPHSKTEAITTVEVGMRQGPCHYKAYRLIPAIETETENSSEEGADDMATTKKTVTKKPAAEKTPSAPKKEKVLVAGKWFSHTVDGKLYTFLADMKPHTLSEILKAVNPPSPKNLENNAINTIRRYGKKTGMYSLVVEGGNYKMSPSAGQKQPAKAKTPATPAVTTAKKPTVPAKKVTAPADKKKASTPASKPSDEVTVE